MPRSPRLCISSSPGFSKLGSAPELVRLPSLIAGTAVIPLIYLVGSRTIGRPAGLIAATVMALSPFMIFYSADARSYSVAIVLLLGSTLAMLSARLRPPPRLDHLRRTDRPGMFTHYLAAFILGAQLLWLLWAFPEARRTAIVANAGAVLLFVPWIPSMLADFDSPTIEVLSLLQGDGFDVKREAVEAWAFGYPYNIVVDMPGRLLVTLGTLALLLGRLRVYGDGRRRDCAGRRTGCRRFLAGLRSPRRLRWRLRSLSSSCSASAAPTCSAPAT